MRDFWRTTLAVIFGLFLYSILSSVIWLLLLINMAVSAQSGRKPVMKNSILVINLDKPVKDKVLTEDFPSLGNKKPLSLTDIKNAINFAAGDKRIKGILLQSRTVLADWAQTEEIRKALQEFKQSGKFIIAYSDLYSQKAYYLASVADRVYIVPTGTLLWTGLSAELMYYKRLLDKLGVDPILIRHGEYKTAAEPFIRDKMSEPNREQYTLLLNRIWNNMLSAIAQSRGISVNKLNDLADNLLVRGSEDALRYSLVDGEVYYDQLVDTVKNLIGLPADKKVPMIKLQDYIKVVNVPSSGKNKIAVVYAQGNIVDVANPYGDDNQIVGSRYARLLDKIRKDPEIKAVVLRVNSPGGSAMASEQIWREVQLIKQVKPIVVSMGGVAASGGYYISCAADEIVADSMTITGSIGVFGLFFNAQKLMNDKLGITTSVVKTNDNADFGSIFHPMNEDQKDYIRTMIEDVYNRFISHVAQGRGLSVEYVDSIARGRVWQAIDAYHLGLVDTLGDLDLAISLAAQKAGIRSYRIVEYPKPKTWLEVLLQNSVSVKANVVEANIPQEFKRLISMQWLLQKPGIWALMPYAIEIQ